ncbi:MAG: HAD-IA family hydrolase [Candidatus Cloacimonetes bacterium]|nr:HAD-IA family hydrolase [Candidatus Cloacimonadota bacterium]
MKPFLLFDFDGTIADSINIGWKIANILAPEFGHKEFSQEDFELFRSLQIHKIFQALRIPIYKIPKAISMALVEYQHLVHELEPCEDIVPMLNTLSAMHIPMALLSSNTRENLSLFLQRLQIDAFDWVEGTSGILKKQHRIKKQIKKHNLNPKDVIYIGDETRDIDAAKNCGLKVIAVTWGFHTAELLSSHDPDYLVNSPDEIVRIVEQLI